jgi:hypothetical protein
MAEFNGSESNGNKYLGWRWLAGILLAALVAVTAGWVRNVNEAVNQVPVLKTNIETIKDQLDRIEHTVDRIEDAQRASRGK